jgi:hypothetical protein
MSGNDKQQALINAVFKLIRPLVRILLRNGMPYGVFADIAKKAYVDVANQDFRIDGRKQSDTRISTITGLNRKEVAKLKKDTIPVTPEKIEKYHRAARVVYGWVHDPDYQDQNGNCMQLSFDQGEFCFTNLVKKYSGDMTPRAILDELLQAGIVQKHTSDKKETLELLERAFIPSRSELEKLAILGTDAYGLINTIDHNIYKDAPPRFQRKVFYDNLPDEHIDEIKQYIAAESQKLLEKVDQKMAPYDRDVNPDVDGEGKNAIGVGVFYFEDDDISEK